MVRPPLGLFERKYRKKPQIVQSIDGMGDSEDFLLNKVGEGGSNNWFQQSRSPNCQYWGLFSCSLLNLLTQHGFWREYPTHQELILLISIYFPQCGSLKTLGNQMTFSPSRRYSNRCRVQGNLRPKGVLDFWLDFNVTDLKILIFKEHPAPFQSY